MIRYYMGRHKIFIMNALGKKAVIQHLEKGIVGNKEIGYKEVNPYDKDIVLIRHCWRKSNDR